MNNELESLEFMAARWAIELADLQPKTKPPKMPSKLTLAQWCRLCEARSDALKVIGRMRVLKLDP